VVDVSVDDYNSVVNDDHMPSYWLAETLKYLLLIFTPKGHDKYLSLSEYVLTTEAHPLKIRPDLLNKLQSAF
jgi:hypothetical protein